MAAVYASVTEANALTALRSFILSMVDCEVIRTPANRASLPDGDFVAMSPVSLSPLATNTHNYTETTQTILRPDRFGVQLDCYGARAGDRAKVLSTLFRDAIAVQSFKASGYDMAPLYAEDARQMPIVSGEEQYIERWSFECAMQLNPLITLAQETANELEPGLISVDRVYPP